MKSHSLKIKTLITGIMALGFTFLLAVEITTTAKAVSSPVTGPLTNPITSPITGPMGNFTISGNIKYHFLSWFHKGPKFAPAVGVSVKATEFFGHNNTVTTTTDANGNYTLPAVQKGLYQVSVSGGESSFYVPPIRVVPDNNPAGKNNVNFQGLLFSR